MNAQQTRFTSIEGLLSAQPAPPQRPKYQLDDAGDAIAEASVRTNQPSHPQQAAQHGAESHKQPRITRVSFRLAPELKTRLAERSLHDRYSQADLIKSAIEHAETTGAFKGAFDEMPASGLFTRSAQVAASASAPSEIRLPSVERDLIDSLAKQYGAKDRTALIVKALSLYLW